MQWFKPRFAIPVMPCAGHAYHISTKPVLVTKPILGRGCTKCQYAASTLVLGIWDGTSMGSGTKIANVSFKP